MNKKMKYLALGAVLLSGLGAAQAEASSVSINAGRGGVSVVVANCNGGHRCATDRGRVYHDLRDRRHVDHCRMCQDALRRDRERREFERRERERREFERRRGFRPMPPHR